MHENTLFSFLVKTQVCTSISDLIQPEGQKHIIPHKLQQYINLHKRPPLLFLFKVFFDVLSIPYH